MSRAFVHRLIVGIFGLIAFFALWSLAYELVTAARWNPALPAEGTSRWALLRYQNTQRSLSGLLVAWQHFSERLVYPPTRSETMVRGAIAAAAVVAIGVAMTLVSIINRKPTHLGNARFGTIMDAEKKNLLAKQGLILGKMGGATIRSDEPSHVLVVGPTRSGKGVSFVIPNGYMWRGSSVWFDPKRENFEAFGAHRQALGDKVFFFSPGERDSHRYNPLDFIRRDARMPTDCAVVSSFIIPEATGSSEIWARAGRQLLTAMIGYVLTSPRYEGQRHLRAVTMLLSTGVDFLRVLTNIHNDEEGYLPRWVLQGLNQFIALEKETRNSAYFNLTAALNPWTNDLVAAATSTTDFDISKLRKDPTALFIGCSVAQLDVFRPIIKILVQQIHDVLMAALPGPDEPHQVLVMIDEFRQLGKMDSVVSKLTINAGYGFRMVLILQDLAQLDEVYGKATRQTTVSACQVKLFIRMNDMETSEYVSEMLGSTTIEVRTPIIRAGQGFFGARDKSVSYQERRLQTSAELRQMPAKQAIVLVPNAPGFMVRKVTYYQDAPYKTTYQEFRGRRLKVPPLSTWQDLPLRSMAEVEAAVDSKPAVPFELEDPETIEAPSAGGTAYAEAIPPGRWPIPSNGAAAEGLEPVELKPKANWNSSDASRKLPNLDPRPIVEPEASAPESELASNVPELKPKGIDQGDDGAPWPLPGLGGRSAPASSSAPGTNVGKDSILQFQVRPENKATSIAALLASLDLEIENSARSLVPEDGASVAAIAALHQQISRHGDRRDAGAGTV
ncbi:type IV secretory system conjugative DNA transfer family protein [Rhizobium sp. NXC24]|uniref:type IV secretory system conjugative DNA transfer family protein n=1 Tax=Rhizobium sp. NXC24 TaxID=2048897 RepID=UPI000CDF478D|nr:type IV secretory system conjugative DNA transfer family protein [Rhizobium sp. NXC24]AVA23828.1 type IV secretion system TraG-like protein [Rhizobium sp. NXC24]